MDNQNGNDAKGDGLTAADAALGDSAYALLLPEFEALKASDLVPITVDTPSTVTTVIGSLPEIEALLPDLQKVAPEIDLALLNKIRQCALALSYAHARYLSASSPSNELLELVETGTALRQTLLYDANALAQRGIINQGKLADLQGAAGFKNLAVDLTILASVLKEQWAEIQGNSGVKATEIEEALRIAERIFTSVGLKEQGPATVGSATDLRVRAFTFLTKLWDTVRQAVTFVRWKQKDVDKIAPSLYAGKVRRRDDTETPTTDVPMPPPAPPVPAPVAGATQGAPSSPAAPGGVGSPNAEPFMT
jgi:hypothetical protein